LYYSLVFGKYSKLCYAIEPNTANFRILKDHIMSNKMTEKVVLCPYALYSIDGQLSLNPGKDPKGSNGFIEEIESKIFIKVNTIQRFIEIEKLDLTQKYNIKIDVEGAEFELLKVWNFDVYKPVIMLSTHSRELTIKCVSLLGEHYSEFVAIGYSINGTIVTKDFIKEKNWSPFVALK